MQVNPQAQMIMLQTTRMGVSQEEMILPVLAKARVKMTLEETLLQGYLQMMSRIQKEMNIIKEFQGKKTS